VPDAVLWVRVHPGLRRPVSDRTGRLTSIYSKRDGVVRWQESIVPEADCVQVTGSHIGHIFNRKTYKAIADALAEPELHATD
jgi:hypothetical protein